MRNLLLGFFRLEMFGIVDDIFFISWRLSASMMVCNRRCRLAGCSHGGIQLVWLALGLRWVFLGETIAVWRDLI